MLVSSSMPQSIITLMKKTPENIEINRKAKKGMLFRVAPERPVNPFIPPRTRQIKPATQTLRN